MRYWGYNFRWSRDHLTAEQLRPMMFQFDELGSEVLDRLDEISPPTVKSPAAAPAGTGDGKEPKSQEQKPAGPRRDLYDILRANKDKDKKLGQLWKEVTTIPEWVDWDQIERGQRVFYRYGGPVVLAVSTTYFLPSLAENMGCRGCDETSTPRGSTSSLKRSGISASLASSD